MARKVTHYQLLNNSERSYCNRVAINVGDSRKGKVSIFRNRVTCQHCKAAMKRDGIEVAS